MPKTRFYEPSPSPWISNSASTAKSYAGPVSFAQRFVNLPEALPLSVITKARRAAAKPIWVMHCKYPVEPKKKARAIRSGPVERHHARPVTTAPMTQITPSEQRNKKLHELHLQRGHATIC